MHELSKADLEIEWRKYFKGKPPPRASVEFLRGHVAWKQQAKQHGGLKRATNTQIRNLVKQLRAGVDLTPEKELTIKPGTRLIRQYKGEKHEVTVTEKGFRYRDQNFTSLSTIARHITGTNWNGRVFFGLKKR